MKNIIILLTSLIIIGAPFLTIMQKIPFKVTTQQMVPYEGTNPCPPIFFEAIGDLPGNDFYSSANDISADGRRVVGFSDADDGNVGGGSHPIEAFGWTRPCEHIPFFVPPMTGPGGLIPLGYLPSSIPHTAASLSFGISPDGKVPVGYSDIAGGASQAVVFLHSGVHRLAMAYSYSIARDVSLPGVNKVRSNSDWAPENAIMHGRVIVGYSNNTNQEDNKRPPVGVTGSLAVFWISWKEVQFLPLPAKLTNGWEITSSSACCISDDAKIIGGNLYYNQLLDQYHIRSIPCWWKLYKDHYVFGGELTDLPGGDDCAGITHISGDGTTLVGWGNETSGDSTCSIYPTIACKWSLNTKTSPIPRKLNPLSGLAYSYAHGTNHDGSIIVGTSNFAPCDFSSFDDKATIWNQDNKPKELSLLLGSLLPSGWVLWGAARVVNKNNFVTVTGYGLNPSGENEGWVARWK